MIDRAADLPEHEIAKRFYALLFDDPLLGPLVPDRSDRHPKLLTLYLSEGFRGDNAYLRIRGGCRHWWPAIGAGGFQTRSESGGLP